MDCACSFVFKDYSEKRSIGLSVFSATGRQGTYRHTAATLHSLHKDLLQLTFFHQTARTSPDRSGSVAQC
jgi:hypothetical protein